MKLIFTTHAIRRMFENAISRDDVRAVLASGEVVRVYPEDKPYESRLILGIVSGRPLHVVAADNPDERETYIITVYVPSADIWEADFKTRKKP